MKYKAKKSGISRCPKLLDTKIYKTGQTRGADDDVIYQNRVSRTSTVLIPYVLWPSCANPPNGELNFEDTIQKNRTPSSQDNARLLEIGYLHKYCAFLSSDKVDLSKSVILCYWVSYGLNLMNHLLREFHEG